MSRIALITGGNKGIGAAVARSMAAAGYTVAITGRDQVALDAVCAELGCAGYRIDLADPAARAEGIARIADELAVDVLINNAGVAHSAPLHRTSDAIWEQTLAVNLTSVFAFCRALVPGMVERGWGRVINIASIAGLTGQAYTAAYCASKHGVVGLTRALAVELARSGVTVNAICPGWVETEMAHRAISNIAAKTGRGADWARGQLEAMSPQRRLMQVDEIAHLVESLAADAARGIHGQAIPVDGGSVLK